MTFRKWQAFILSCCLLASLAPASAESKPGEDRMVLEGVVNELRNNLDGENVKDYNEVLGLIKPGIDSALGRLTQSLSACVKKIKKRKERSILDSFVSSAILDSRAKPFQAAADALKDNPNLSLALRGQAFLQGNQAEELAFGADQYALGFTWVWIEYKEMAETIAIEVAPSRIKSPDKTYLALIMATILDQQAILTKLKPWNEFAKEAVKKCSDIEAGVLAKVYVAINADDTKNYNLALEQLNKSLKAAMKEMDVMMKKSGELDRKSIAVDCFKSENNKRFPQKPTKSS